MTKISFGFRPGESRRGETRARSEEQKMIVSFYTSRPDTPTPPRFERRPSAPIITRVSEARLTPISGWGGTA